MAEGYFSPPLWSADMITQEEASKWFSYNPETGVIRWLKLSSNRTKADRAGSTNALGYIMIRLHGRCFYAHRLAFLLMTGHWPTTHIDHIDGDRSNNKWSNLRAVTHSRNLVNSKLYISNTSGFKGVHKDKRSGRFHAHGSMNGKKVHLGSFDTPEAAQAAYVDFTSARFGAEYVRIK